MISKTISNLAVLIAILALSSNAASENNDIKGCWRVERHIFTLTDGSSRQEEGKCVLYYGDTESSIACNFKSDPDYRHSFPYKVIKQGAVSVLSTESPPYQYENEYEIRKEILTVYERFKSNRKISKNEWATSKMLIASRLNIKNLGKCLSQAKLIPKSPEEIIKPVELAPGVIDFPRPVIKTKIELARFGKMLWLDSGHLAVTAADSERTHGQGKIISIDLSDQSMTTLLESGFLWRTNPETSLVSVTKGRIMQGNDNPSNNVFYRWDRRKNALVDEEKSPKPSRNGRFWNWNTCSETTKEDSEKSFFKEITGKAYLRFEDGILNWSSMPPPPQGFSVSLISAKGMHIPLNLNSYEVMGVPAYFPFIQGYVLSGGLFATGGGTISYREKKVDQIPLVMLKKENEVVRSYLPKALKTYLDKWLASGTILPTAEGLLIYVGGTASEGGGIYLNKGDTSNRVWCSPLDKHGENCNLIALEVSPDGCNVAIIPQAGISSTPVILPICIKK